MTTTDQNFDDRKGTFRKNIYGTSKGRVREAVLTRDLKQYIDLNLDSGKTLSVLDVGGGQGQLAIRLAELGHEVTLTDISEEMLTIAKQAAQEKELENINFKCLPLQELSENLNEKYDLVLCHAVFEWLEKPREAFSILNVLCKPSGAISFMFYNKIGQTLSNLVYGNFDYIRAGMKAKRVVKLNPQSALEPADVYQWVSEEKLTIAIKSGVRVFHDYIRDVNKWESDVDNILDMELKYSQLAPYTEIGRYMHLILTQV